MSVFIKKIIIILIAFNICGVTVFSQVMLPESQIEREIDEEFKWLQEEAIVITASKKEEHISDAPAVVSVIHAEDIRNMGARDIIDVLLTVPGIDISHTRFGQNVIGIRGIKTDNSEKVKLLIDGHSVNEPFMGGAMILHDDLAIENVKRIEIIRGPGSALYGANAFTGIIHIITYDADDIDGVEIHAGGGTFNTKNAWFMFGKETGEWKLSGFFKYYDSDGPRLDVEEDAAGNPAKTRIPKEKIALALKAEFHDLKLNGRFTRRKRGDYGGILSMPNDETEMDLNQGFLELSYARRFGGHFNILWKLAYDRFEEDILFEFVPDTTYFYAGLTNRNFNTELQLDYDLWEDNVVTIGFVGESIKQYNLGFKGGDHPDNLSAYPLFNKEGATRKILAVYLQDIWKPAESVKITGGMRYDHYSDFGDTLNPRIGLTWKFSSGLYAKALYGQAFRAPSFIELYDDSMNSVGNLNLDPEKIQTTEVLLGYNANNRIQMTATFFHKKIKDLIRIDNSVGQPWPYVNGGNAKVRGAEVEIRGNLSDTIHCYANYSYQNPRDNDTGERLPDVPIHKGNMGLNLKFADNLNLSLHTFFSGKRSRAKEDIRDDAKAYSVSNLTVRVENIFPRTELNISCHNIFDKAYRYSSPLNTLPQDFPQPGRQIFAGLKTVF